jgi:hypothetical protein
MTMHHVTHGLVASLAWCWLAGCNGPPPASSPPRGEAPPSSGEPGAQTAATTPTPTPSAATPTPATPAPAPTAPTPPTPAVPLAERPPAPGEPAHRPWSEIDDAQRACTADADCVLIDTCCHSKVAVARAHAPEGPPDCTAVLCPPNVRRALPDRAVCRAGLCSAVEP